MHENCAAFKMPTTNSDYWLPKLLKNQQRDKANILALKSAGWKVLVVWGCELKSKNFKERMEKLYSEIMEAD